jgi:hypothetical protein
MFLFNFPGRGAFFAAGDLDISLPLSDRVRAFVEYFVIRNLK